MRSVLDAPAQQSYKRATSPGGWWLAYTPRRCLTSRTATSQAFWPQSFSFARGCALAAMPAYLLCVTAMMLGGPETALRKQKFYADD